MTISHIQGPNGTLAYSYSEGDKRLPSIIFLCGFKSDMMGSKAQWLHEYCANNNRTYLRFDYFAHGQSEGNFKDFTIGKGLADTLFMIENFIDQPAILIGSSMGGWIGLRAVQLIPHLIHGFIGIAAAPDFTRKIYNSLDDGHLAQLAEHGYIKEDSGYDEPYIFTRALFEDGENHCLLDKKIEYDGYVHLLQGKQDSSVHYDTPGLINHCFDGRAKITLIHDGDHSLSRPQDLDVLKQAIEEMTS